jgi:hypothetical protein
MPFRYQSFFGHEDWMDDRIHLMHVGAGPHDPHADGSDDAGDQCYSNLWFDYCLFADLA